MTRFIFVSIILAGFGIASYPQGVCVPVEQRLAFLKGQVMFKDKTVMPNATVKVYKDKEANPTWTVVSDENGDFEVPHARRGKYWVAASYPELMTFTFPVILGSKGIPG